jgi:rhodanese-related sulfurtransferase
MKKTIQFLLVVMLFCLSNPCQAANYRNLTLSDALLDSGITIVDIRTEPEWRETGVVPGSVLLTFFRPDRSYNLEDFTNKLDQHAASGEEIALLCRSGNRSAKLAHLLAERGYTSIINITGGIRNPTDLSVKLVPYPASP